tara:strand:- start:629 stop:982 length:354 start_codon:yes stop_codon:yes gene_type:complete
MYKRVYNSDTIIRLSDNASIPADESNSDYVKFLADVAADPDCVTDADVADEPRRLVPKSTILSRLTDQQLDAALRLMSVRQKERWRVPDKPSVYFDDPEIIAVLKAIGADPDMVMAK